MCLKKQRSIEEIKRFIYKFYSTNLEVLIDLKSVFSYNLIVVNLCASVILSAVEIS